MTEEVIQYLRELVVVEVTYSNLNNNQASKDPDEVRYLRSTWRKFVWNTPTYASTLVIMDWTDIEAPTVERLACQLWCSEENLSSSLTLRGSGETVPTVPAT